MSEKNSGTNHAPKSIDTLIGAGMRVEGDIACTGVLRVQGEILGNVSCQENPNATLMVDNAGNVSGTVCASRIIARGSIVGPVRSPHSIEIHQGGSIAGDISYNAIAIHSGGVIDGILNPLAATEAGRPNPPGRASRPDQPAIGTSAVEAPTGGLGVRSALAIAVALAVGAGVWISRNPDIVARHSEDTALDKPETVLKTTSEAPLAPAPPPPEAAKAAVPETPTPLAQRQQVDAPEADAASTHPAADIQNGVVTVRGINPARPPGVFLLISNEQSVLFRKKDSEAGDGDRLVVSGGEKVSVAVAPNELIRVAQGRDVVILYQGKKVPREIIESGAWISFVPR